MATESPQSPTQSSPMSCSHANSPHSSPPHSSTQAGLSPTQVQPVPAEPQQSPLPQSPAQDNTTQTQLDRPCSPTNIIITQPQHSSPQRRHSPMPHSPAQDAEPTLDQESPGSTSPARLRWGAAQDISTLDQDLSPVFSRSTQTARRHTSLKPISAPCSPSSTPLRATQCSLSQPASPVQANSSLPVRPSQLSLLLYQLTTSPRVTKECTQTSTTELKSLEHSPMQLSPNLDGQTLESSAAPLSPTSNQSTMPPNSHGTDGKLPNQLGAVQSSALNQDQDHSSHLHVPAVPTPESLVHISTSVHHSSLTCSPCADELEEVSPPASPPCDSPSCGKEVIEGKSSPIHIQNSSASASPKHASQMPTSSASSVQGCASLMPVKTSPTHLSPNAAETSPVTLPINPMAPPVRSSTQPANPSAVLARPIHHISCQEEEMEVAVDQPRHSLQSETSPIHPNYTPDSPAQTTYSGYNLMGSMHAQERTCPSVNSFAEVTQTLTSPSPTYPGQSSLSLVQTTYSPSRTSPLPTPTSFSPPHCRPTDTSPASSSVSHSLSHSGQTSSHSVSVNDVGAIHSPPRASPAGQASPVHIQSSSSSPDSGQVQRPTPSLASMTYSSPAHAAVACVSPPHSPALAR